MFLDDVTQVSKSPPDVVELIPNPIASDNFDFRWSDTKEN